MGGLMVGVHRLQALLASHGASATSHIPGWIHWPEAPQTFVVAVLIGWLSILWGFHHKGRPFGSPKATVRTLTLLAVTALIAALLSVLVPHLPFSLGIFLPALLCGAIVKEDETIQELRIANADLAAFVRIGIFYFLKCAAEQIAEDRTTWCEDQLGALKNVPQGGVENRRTSLSKFADAARELRSKLDRRVSKDLKVQVKDHFDAVDNAVKAAKQARSIYDQKFNDEYDNAEGALFMLLQFAYNWKLKKLSYT
jgi:hypothetical protein